MSDTKRCYACKAALPVAEFHKNRTHKDGRADACRKCVLMSSKAWREANPEKAKARKKAWYEANSEKAKARSRTYQAAHSEKLKATGKAWRESHPLEVAAGARLCYARRHGATVVGDIPVTIKADLIAEYGPTCMFPGCEATKLTFDHVIPISKGGLHTVANLQLLCQPHNRSKGTASTDYRLVVDGDGQGTFALDFEAAS